MTTSKARTPLVATAATALLVGACAKSEPPRPQARMVDPKYGTSPSPRVVANPMSRVQKGGGTYKVGAPYVIAGRTYVPQDNRSYDASGQASWYGADFHGRKTANGEVFDMWALTAAHPTLPMPSLAYVTNLDTGRTVLVRINDRGPYAHNRIIDLSRMTARVLGVERQGIGRVRVQYAGPAPLSGDDSAERQWLHRQQWAEGRTLDVYAREGQVPSRYGVFGQGGRMSLGVGLQSWEGFEKTATTDEIRRAMLQSSDGR